MICFSGINIVHVVQVFKFMCLLCLLKSLLICNILIYSSYFFVNKPLPEACLFFGFFFKQKTAYEISECDWSSDVCSSDLLRRLRQENCLNPGSGGCGEPRSRHCTPAWVTRTKFRLKKKKQKQKHGYSWAEQPVFP